LDQEGVVNLLLAICLGICLSPNAVTPEQRDATELLSILEYLGGIEDDAKWEELVHTLDAKVSTGNTAVNTSPTDGAEAETPSLELVEFLPADGKDS
jgi:hypothetical protein